MSDNEYLQELNCIRVFDGLFDVFGDSKTDYMEVKTDQGVFATIRNAKNCQDTQVAWRWICGSRQTQIEKAIAVSDDDGSKHSNIPEEATTKVVKVLNKLAARHSLGANKFCIKKGIDRGHLGRVRGNVIKGLKMKWLPLPANFGPLVPQ